MKKNITLFLGAFLCVSLLFGCRTNPVSTETIGQTKPPEVPTIVETEPTVTDASEMIPSAEAPTETSTEAVTEAPTEAQTEPITETHFAETEPEQTKIEETEEELYGENETPLG